MERGMRRRDFFKVLAAGGATATAIAGCSDPPEKLIPFLLPPDNIEFSPGIPVDYATTCSECPAGCGMVIRTREGRAIKAEGNPDHPVNRGALCIRGQASMQTLYNPARIRSAMLQQNGQWSEGDWEYSPITKRQTKTYTARMDEAVYGMLVVTQVIMGDWPRKEEK